jgi:glutaredoxin
MNPNPLHIIVYGTQTCPFTQQVTGYLVGHGKAFTFVDTSTQQGLDAFNTNVKSKMTHHHDSIPLIYVDGTCIGGYKEFMKKAEKGSLHL